MADTGRGADPLDMMECNDIDREHIENLFSRKNPKYHSLTDAI